MPNLIDLIKQQVTPKVLGQLARMTGENTTKIEGAVDAIVPTLVCGALSKSATPAGAQGLLDAIGSQGSPDDFASLLGGGDGTRNLLKQGGDIVSSLFGAKANQIANGISSATSIGGSSASILMYALAPLALSVVGQTLGSGDLDPTALTNLLADQRESVQAAMPTGLGNLVDCSAPGPALVPVAAKVEPLAVPVAAKVEPAPVPVAAKVEPALVPVAAKVAPPAAPKPAVTAVVPPPPPRSRSIWRWLGLLLLLLILGGLLWWFLIRPQTETLPPAAATPAPAAATNTPAAAVAPLTATVAAESTTSVTETTAVTGTAEITATGSVTPTDTAEAAATAAPAVDNAAVCTALAQLDLVFGAAPAITATTAVTDVRSFAGRADLVTAAVATAAEGIPDVDLGEATTAAQDLATAVQGLTGDTVGDAAVPVETALNNVRDSYAKLNTDAGCP